MASEDIIQIILKDSNYNPAIFSELEVDAPKKGPLCPKVEDYPIFFAVSEKGGKDNSGDYTICEK